MEFKKSDLFYCYSINLFHFLKAKGFYYLVKGLNNNTNKNYWVFVRTTEFNNALSQWSILKEIK